MYSWKSVGPRMEPFGTPARLECSVFLKNFEKNFFLVLLFLLKRSFQGICSFKILIGSA